MQNGTAEQQTAELTAQLLHAQWLLQQEAAQIAQGAANVEQGAQNVEQGAANVQNAEAQAAAQALLLQQWRAELQQAVQAAVTAHFASGSTSSNAPPPHTGTNSVIDPRSIPKVENFSGKEEAWLEWSFAFRSYIDLLGFGDSMRHVELLADPPEFVNYSPATTTNARMLYHILAQI